MIIQTDWLGKSLGNVKPKSQIQLLGTLHFKFWFAGRSWNAFLFIIFVMHCINNFIFLYLWCFLNVATNIPLQLDLRLSCYHTDLICPVSLSSSFGVKLIWYAKLWGFFHLNQVIQFFHGVSKKTIHIQMLSVLYTFHIKFNKLNNGLTQFQCL